MLMIVSGHSIIHGGYGELPLTVNGLFAIALTQGSRIGVDIFILITGYFSVGKPVSIRKIKRLYLQIWIYSVLITSGLIIFKIVPLSIKTILNAIIPISSSQYWFATCYMLLMIISPALQLVVTKLEEKQFRLILIALFLAWSVIPQFHLGNPGYSNFGWFVFVYLLAAYTKLHVKKWVYKVKIIHGALAFVIVCALTVITYRFGFNHNFLKNNAIYLYGEMNMIPTILTALLLFFGFKNWNVKNSRIVNAVASCTFGVYLLHDNPNIRYFIWEQVFGCNNYMSDTWFPLVLMGSIVSIYIIGTVFEMIRQITVRKITDYADFKSEKKSHQ